MRGNVEAKEGARTRAFGSRVDGNYKCDRCLPEVFIFTEIGGNVELVGAGTGITIQGSRIAGDLAIVESTSAFFSFFALVDSVVGGNAQFVKNTGAGGLGAGAFATGNMIAGDLQAVEGTGTVNVFVSNQVGGNVQVFKNQSVLTQIASNTIGENLQCEDNEPPPIGGGNTARDKQGQCAEL